LFYKYDHNKDDFLTIDEFQKLIVDVDSKLTFLPATAQVASQKGYYLANLFNSDDSENYEIFKYKHLGSFTYLSTYDAVYENKNTYFTGISALWMWRSAYFSKQYSFENKLFVAGNWLRSAIFGRNISKFSNEKSFE
jgi:NADH dehydrogenase FAD-containing subunit